MPHFRSDADVKHPGENVEGRTRASVIGICNSFATPHERDDFLDNSNLYDLGRKWFSFFFFFLFCIMCSLLVLYIFLIQCTNDSFLLLFCVLFTVLNKLNFEFVQMTIDQSLLSQKLLALP